MNLNSASLLVQSLFSTIARFAGVGLNFAVAMVITRNLPLSEAGVLFMLMTLVTGIALFSRVGLEQWIVRDIARIDDNDQQKRGEYLHDGYRLMLLSTLIFTVIWIAATPLLAEHLFDNEIGYWHLLAAGLGILFFNIVMMHSAFMKAIRHTSESILIQNSLPAIAFMVLLLIFWSSFTQHQQYLYLYTASLVIAAIASFIWMKPWWSPVVNSQQRHFDLKPLFRQTIILAPVSFFSFLMLWADTLLVGLLLNNEDVALFTIAARLSFVSLFFLGALDATIYPRLLKIHKEQPEKLRSFFWQATILVAAILTGVTLVLSLLGDYLLWAFSETYIAASSTLILLLVAQLMRAMSLTFSFMFIIQEQVKYLNGMLMFALVVNILANFALIPHYGIEGAAIATLSANVVLTLGVVLLFAKKKLLNDYH